MKSLSNVERDTSCRELFKTVFPKPFLLAERFWLWKLTTDPPILAHVNILSGWQYPKLDIYISLLLVAYVTMYCMIWP
jgi:hypothetical protein